MCKFYPNVRGRHHRGPQARGENVPFPRSGAALPALLEFHDHSTESQNSPWGWSGACGICFDGLMRGPQAEDPGLAVTAPAASGGESRAPARPCSDEVAAHRSHRSVSLLPAIRDTPGTGMSAGWEVGGGLFLEGHQVEWSMQKKGAKLPGFKSCLCLYVTLGTSLNLYFSICIMEERRMIVTYCRGFSQDFLKVN